MKSYLDYFFRNPLRNFALLLTLIFFVWMLVLAILPASRYYDEAVQQIENKGLWQKTTELFFGEQTPVQIANSMKQQQVVTMFWLTICCGMLTIVLHLFSYFWFRLSVPPYIVGPF